MVAPYLGRLYCWLYRSLRSRQADQQTDFSDTLESLFAFYE